MGYKAESQQANSQPQWYVLHSHPNKEQYLWSELVARNMEVFYPYLRVKPVNPRSKKIRPYFPGYLFVYTPLDLVGESTFKWMPHTYGLVCFGGAPVPVPETLIIELKRRIEQCNAREEKLEYHRGDSVEVIPEMFSGYEAIFDSQLPGTERVRVLIKMLNDRQVIVELNKEQITRKKNLL